MITVEELNSLMATYYLSDELAEIKWDETTPSDTDKQVLLDRAVDKINALQFDGYKVSQDQQNEFPRVICREVVQTPQDVKEAICRLVYEFRSNITDSRKKLQRAKVKSINTGGVSETYTEDAGKQEVSNEYKRILSPWLYRGV